MTEPTPDPRDEACPMCGRRPNKHLRDVLARDPVAHEDYLDAERLARALVRWGGALHDAGVVTLTDEGRDAARAIATEYLADNP